ncbi:c-type cytochrome [Cognatishimia activa]|uniref:c-type cytochrome n=1 Tax=Cognatishimia activa TaxID=1715691 RepID=UPI00222EC99A|nr:c-type cytochrome [Cognatishimia activa]UZD90837.1 c-type cytochrome [Cognatishimia activa]
MSKAGIFIGIVIVGSLGAFGFKLMNPPAPVGHSMEQPDLGTIKEGEQIVQVALPSALSDDAELGKRFFEAKCAACHGANAAGKKGTAPPLVHKIYEPSHHSDVSFVLAAQNGVRAHHWKFGNMPKIEGITKGEVMLVTKYVRELQRANGIN